MKAIMYALYTTKASKMPRHIFMRAKDAKQYLADLKEGGVRWGIVERVEVTKIGAVAYDIFAHEYKRIALNH